MFQAWYNLLFSDVVQPFLLELLSHAAGASSWWFGARDCWLYQCGFSDSPGSPWPEDAKSQADWEHHGVDALEVLGDVCLYLGLCSYHPLTYNRDVFHACCGGYPTSSQEVYGKADEVLCQNVSGEFPGKLQQSSEHGGHGFFVLLRFCLVAVVAVVAGYCVYVDNVFKLLDAWTIIHHSHKLHWIDVNLWFDCYILPQEIRCKMKDLNHEEMNQFILGILGKLQKTEMVSTVVRETLHNK